MSCRLFSTLVDGCAFLEISTPRRYFNMPRYRQEENFTYESHRADTGRAG